jgi:hypothetical protein
MDIKRKTCDIRTWNRHLFLGISSINIDILVSSLYPSVKTRITEMFRLLFSATSAPGLASSATFERQFLEQVVNNFTRQSLPTVNRKLLIMNILFTESSFPQQVHNRTLLFGRKLLQHGRHFDY